MKPLAWIFIGAIGAGATLISVTTDNDQVAIISGLVGTLSWLLFAYFSLSITTIDQSGTFHTTRYPALAAYGVAMALPNFFVALTGPLEILTNPEDLKQEVR